MLTTLASIVSGVIGVAIIFIGARFLLAPQAAAAGYGVPVEPAGAQTQAGGPYPWLYVKGVRDIASGIFTLHPAGQPGAAPAGRLHGRRQPYSRRRRGDRAAQRRNPRGGLWHPRRHRGGHAGRERSAAHGLSAA